MGSDEQNVGPFSPMTIERSRRALKYWIINLGFQRLIKGTAPDALQQLAATNINDCEAKIAAPCTGY
jgi:hypothetical protein